MPPPGTCTPRRLRVLGVEPGSSPIGEPADIGHREDMEAAAVTETLLATILNPIVLGAAALATLALVTGLAARVVELLEIG